jgi:hypothetical protein
MMHPLSARSVQAQDRSRRRLLLRPRPESGEDAIPPETGVEAETSLEAEAGVGRGRDSSRDRGRGRVRKSDEAETSSRGRSLTPEPNYCTRQIYIIYYKY